MYDPSTALPNLLLAAWLLPLLSFAVISIGYSIPQFVGIRVSYASQKFAAYIAIGAIVGGFVLSSVAMFRVWLPTHSLVVSELGEEASDHAGGSEDASESQAEHNNGHPPYYTGDWYTLGQFGKLKLTIGYYIDALTVTMFCMVTLIASSIHIYAFGYMHDELHEYTDHEVTLTDGQHLPRRGRFHRL